MISIITAYFNRKELFHRTLKSMAKSAYKDIEVIAVDDASRKEERLEDLMEEFPFLKVVRIEAHDKWYCNSCIPFNIGISMAIGDIIVLQNPECIHIGDVLDYFAKNSNEENYLTVATYSIDEQMTKELPERFARPDFMEYFHSLPQQESYLSVGWYNHKIYRPVYYHFCVALSKGNMKLLGGFDERFSYGPGYEDCDFVNRIKRMELQISITENVFVIHQWHPVVYNISIPEINALWDMNNKIYTQTKHETGFTIKNSYVTV
jgi:glycosyltransferase involved in cell wall biosynthesis